MYSSNLHKCTAALNSSINLFFFLFLSFIYFHFKAKVKNTFYVSLWSGNWNKFVFGLCPSVMMWWKAQFDPRQIGLVCLWLCVNWGGAGRGCVARGLVWDCGHIKSTWFLFFFFERKKQIRSSTVMDSMIKERAYGFLSCWRIYTIFHFTKKWKITWQTVK